MTKKVTLNELERTYVYLLKLNEKQILQIKKMWYDALDELKSCLLPESIRSKEIIYAPYCWYIFGSVVSIDKENIIHFSTPNKEVQFDPFPTPQAKLSVIAHEAFGHQADREQYYPDDWSTGIEEYKTFVSYEQRAHLRVVYALPSILCDYSKQRVYSSFKLLNIKPDLGEYEEAFETIEILGIAGLRRRDNVPEFLKEVKETRGLPIDKYLEKCRVYSLAGLAVPPGLNHERGYGVRRDDWVKIMHETASYIRGEVKTPPEIPSAPERYRAEYSVDLRWINLERARDELNKEISRWENKSRRHSRFYCFEDMYKSLQTMHERVEKELKNSSSKL